MPIGFYHSLSSQDTSSVEIEFVPESEGQLDNGNISQTDVFPKHHDYELFLLNQEIDTPSDNLSHQEGHNCEKLWQDDPLFTHATDLSLTLTLPHFMHSTTEKNRIPLILLLQFQPLPKLQVITQWTQFVPITHSQVRLAKTNPPTPCFPHFQTLGSIC